ncbi:MATE family multidrug resistance protein [Litorivivens lipolytica]|uniref:Multidrug-efflux transporter n=1 Tax=Litorivivens lipolytica TaxID=1524264 RepID=A0A7W4Z6G3_9GAMM|nr:MATE family efflux transporter [Litorivivens lipolytica]MBB3048484.1 MATE family multidrug resistance protein [Litorivivens lipolytica]
MTVSRRELNALLALAVPILGGQLAQTANGFVDTVMAGRVSANDLAAVAVGASVWVPLYLFMTGVLMSVTPILSRHLGGERHERINPLAQQALWLSLGLGALGFLVLRSMGPVLNIMDVDAAIRPLVDDYLKALSWGMPGAALWLALRSYTEAMSHSRPVLWISVIGLLVNIPCNYVLIYGKFGFPELGGVGCGWATSLVLWLMALLMAGYIAVNRVYQQARLSLRERHLEWSTLFYMLRLGLPVGLSIFFEVSIFSVIALLISRLGAETVAGHQIALNFTALIFMVPLSFALATTVRVGRARGREDRDALRAAVKTSMQVSIAIGLLASVLLLLARHHIPLIYTDNHAVHALAAHLLIFAALYQVSDAIQVWASGCLRGFEDTAWPMVLTLLSYWGIGLPLGYVLGLTDILVPAMGPSGFWIGLVAGLSGAAILLGVRLIWRMRQPLSQ